MTGHSPSGSIESSGQVPTGSSKKTWAKIRVPFPIRPHKCITMLKDGMTIAQPLSLHRKHKTGTLSKLIKVQGNLLARISSSTYHMKSKKNSIADEKTNTGLKRPKTPRIKKKVHHKGF